MTTSEQKILTVANNDTDVNAAITAQAADGWITAQLIVSGSDIIILFTRLTPAEA